MPPPAPTLSPMRGAASVSRCSNALYPPSVLPSATLAAVEQGAVQIPKREELRFGPDRQQLGPQRPQLGEQRQGAGLKVVRRRGR